MTDYDYSQAVRTVISGLTEGRPSAAFARPPPGSEAYSLTVGTPTPQTVPHLGALVTFALTRAELTQLRDDCTAILDETDQQPHEADASEEFSP